MKGLIDLLNALGPLFQAITPLMLGLGAYLIPYWLKKQTGDLKAHSDENREQIKDAVISTTGTHKLLSPDVLPPAP